MTQLVRSHVAYVDLSVFAHATEDQNKVLEAAQNILTPELVDRVSFSKSNLKGEYGNSITFLETRIKADIAESLLQNISLNLTSLDKETLHRDFNMHLRKGSLYIRLDKQEAYKGRFRLCRADPIHIRIRFKTTNVEEIREICRKIGIIS